MQIQFLFSSTLRFAAATALLLCSSMSLNADVINVDLGPGTSNGGTQVGLAGAPDAAGATAFWNGINVNTTSNLIDSSGTVTTTVGFSLSGGMNDIPGAQELMSGQAALMADYFSLRDQDGAITGGQTINGLIAGNSYDLYIYGQGDNFGGGQNGGQNVGIRIGDVVRHTGYDGTAGGDGILAESVEYVQFLGLVADPNGAIVFERFNPNFGVNNANNSALNDTVTGLADGDNNASRFSAINGFQIVGDFTAAVPEPSSMTALGLIALGICTRRRRG